MIRKIIFMMILLAGIVSGHTITVEDNAPVSDVRLGNELLRAFDGFEMMPECEADMSRFDETITVMIDDGDVIIIVGEQVPASDVILAIELQDHLMDMGYDVDKFLSSEVPDSVLSRFRGSCTGTEILYAQPGEIFPLELHESARIKEYNLNIHFVDVAESCAACACDTQDCECPGCTEAAVFEVSTTCADMNMRCAAIEKIHLGEDKSVDVLGYRIKLVDLEGEKAILMVSEAKEEDTIYVRLNQRFRLALDQKAILEDYLRLNIRIDDIGESEGQLKLTIESEEDCTTGSTMECGITGTTFNLAVGQSKEAFDATFELLDIGRSDGKNYAILAVTKNSQKESYVDVSITPDQKAIHPDETATFSIMVRDNHPAGGCTSGTSCVIPVHTYRITVSGLPFSNEYQRTVTLTPGNEKTILLTVSPNQIYEEVRTISGVNEKVSAPHDMRVSSAPATAGGRVAEPTMAVTDAKEGHASERRYKFSVTATDIDSPSNTDMSYAYLVIEPEVPMPYETITLHKGWNLVSLPGKLIKFQKADSIEKLVGYIWLKDEQKFVTLNEAERIMGDGLREYLMENAFWVYSKTESTIVAKIDYSVSATDIEIVKGWNMVPVTEDMIGGSLSDIIGSCNIESMYIWEASRQNWEKIGTSHSFNSLGTGFVMKARERCTFYGQEPTPPPMPGVR